MLSGFFYIWRWVISKKTTTKNEVSWSPPPRTAEVSGLSGMVDQSGDDGSTAIRNAYARAKQENTRSYNNPLGAYTTADVRDKSIRAQNAAFNQSMGMDLAEAAQAHAQNRFGRQATLAGFTQPQMYNSQSVQKTSDPWGTALGFAGAGANVAGGALSGSKK